MTLMRRPYRDGIELSIIGFGGMVAVSMPQDEVNRISAESFDVGVNYFDVAPFYGEGEAEKKLGIALQLHRERIFLANKTLQRRAARAREELERSLRRLHTTRFDLYQFHAVTTLKDVETICGPGGALEAFVEARAEGKIRYIGFSAHSTESAIAMLDGFPFDSVLFPVNYACYARGSFGPQVLQKARQQGVAIIALKAMAHGPWRKGEVRKFSKCWYRPIEDPGLAKQALRFALSEDVTSIIPPGEAFLFRLALDLAADLPTLSPCEREQLLAAARGLRPLFRAGGVTQ